MLALARYRTRITEILPVNTVAAGKSCSSQVWARRFMIPGISILSAIGFLALRYFWGRNICTNEQKLVRWYYSGFL